MLRVEDRFMIKDLHRRGMTMSGIARVTGHDRKTIRAIVNGPANPEPKRRRAALGTEKPYALRFPRYLSRRAYGWRLYATDRL